MSETNLLKSDHAIDPELFYLIRMLLPEGETILELGSGDGTALLCKHWNVISVEDDPIYLKKHHDQYIYAPLRKHKAVRNHEGDDRWYDPSIMKVEIPKIDYDLLLIDGPAGANRAGVLKYWDLFKHPDRPVIIDDVHRRRDHKIAVSLSAKLGRPFCTYNTWVENETHFALIPAVGGSIPAEIVCK